MLYGFENEVRVGHCKIRKPSKHAENQYTLISTDDGHFFAIFKDGEGNDQMSEITKDLYQEMFQQARADDAYLRWSRRHSDDSADMDSLSDKSADTHHRSVEDTAIAKALFNEKSSVMSALTDLQCRRLMLRFFHGLSLCEIAALEGCSFNSIKRSIDAAIANLQKNIFQGG